LRHKGILLVRLPFLLPFSCVLAEQERGDKEPTCSTEGARHNIAAAPWKRGHSWLGKHPK